MTLKETMSLARQNKYMVQGMSIIQQEPLIWSVIHTSPCLENQLSEY